MLLPCGREGFINAAAGEFQTSSSSVKVKFLPYCVLCCPIYGNNIRIFKVSIALYLVYLFYLVSFTDFLDSNIEKGHMSNPNKWITKGLQLSEEMHIKKHVAKKIQKTSERQTSSLLAAKE